MAAWIFLCISSLVICSLYKMFNSPRQHLFSEACVLFSNSAVTVHDSQAYRNMEMTRERTSLTFDPRDMLLSLQMCFSSVRAAVASAILEKFSGLEPSSETTAPRYLKLVTVPSFCPFTFISLYGCHWRCLSSVWLSRHRSPSYIFCRLCRDFLLVLLDPALPQLERLCHRQTAD